MHTGIAIVCYAEDKDQALEQATKIADDLVESGEFDYHMDFDNSGEGFESLNLSEALPVSKPKVKELLDMYMSFTKNDFLRNLGELRSALEGKTDEEMWAEEDDMWKYYAGQLGAYYGHSVRIYDNDGEGIRDDAHYKNVLSKWDKQTDEYKNLNVYILFQDVHY